MASVLLILLSTVLVNIIAMQSASRWRPFAALDDCFAAARGLAIASLLAIPILSVSSWLLFHHVLQPRSLGYLRTPAFAALLLAVVPLVELVLRRYSRLVPERPGFALLLATNSMLLGVALLASERWRQWLDALAFSLAAAAALGFLLLAFAAMHERLRQADVPEVFRDLPLSLITAGIMALAFMGFTGLIQEGS